MEQEEKLRRIFNNRLLGNAEQALDQHSRFIVL